MEENNIYKGRSYPIGTVRTWKDGGKYKKVAPNKWVEVGEGKKKKKQRKIHKKQNVKKYLDEIMR